MFWGVSLGLPWPEGIDEHFIQYSWYKPYQTELDTEASVSGLQWAKPVFFIGMYKCSDIGSVPVFGLNSYSSIRNRDLESNKGVNHLEKCPILMVNILDLFSAFGICKVEDGFGRTVMRWV
jgi:hypothetical protein